MTIKKIFSLISISTGVALTIFALVSALIQLRRNTSAGDVIQVIPVEVNYQAPDIQLKSLRGENVSLSNYFGNVILYNAWATWCFPCAEEMPTLQKYFDLHKADGFLVVAIEDGQSVEEINSFIQKYNLSFLVFPDPTYIATTAFRVNALPTSFIIDRAGIVRLTWLGAITMENLEKYVTPIIDE